MNKLTNEQKYKTAEERGQGGKGKRGEVMSTEKQETIADIVADMRKDIADGTVGIWSDFGGEIARCYADRIEAAAKREREAGADAAQICGEIGELIGREETREKSSQVGNAAKMRDALDAITRIDTRRLKRLLCELVEAEILDGGQINRTISAVEKARQALSAPPRNCDMYTTLDDARNAFFADYVSDETCSSTTAFAIWLYDEEKGEADEHHCID